MNERHVERLKTGDAGSAKTGPTPVRVQGASAVSGASTTPSGRV